MECERGTACLILRLQPGDEDRLAETISRVKTPNSTPPSAEYLARFLADDANYVGVALLDDAVVGFVLAYRLMRIDRDQGMLYLHEIDVLPEYQRRGIGTALMNAVQAYGRAAELQKMWLGTEETNTAAMALYQKTGGKRLGNDEEGFYWSFAE